MLTETAAIRAGYCARAIGYRPAFSGPFCLMAGDARRHQFVIPTG
jgi:hypothetical protein